MTVAQRRSDLPSRRANRSTQRTQTRGVKSPATSQPAQQVKGYLSAFALIDIALVVVVVLVGLMMTSMGIAGIATELLGHQASYFNLFNGGITVISGIAWLAIAPRKVLSE